MKQSKLYSQSIFKEKEGCSKIVRGTIHNTYSMVLPQIHETKMDCFTENKNLIDNDHSRFQHTFLCNVQISYIHYFASKGPSSQGYDFSSGHVWMWELDYKESWARKNWYFWTVELEKTLESPLDCEVIQPVHPKGDQSWGSLEGLMLKLKLQYFGHLMQRVDSFEKTLMLGKIEAGGEGDNRGWDG